jgi:hypothetical protein
MKRILSIVLAAAFAVSAQNNLNWNGFDSSQIATFRADSLKFSKPFILSNAENKLLVIVYDDTANAGRNGDSVKASVFYQLGSPIITGDKTYDTVWTNCIPLDTIAALTTANYYNPLTATGATIWSLDASTDLATRPHSQVDTTLGTSSSALWVGFTPYWSPYIRFGLKGLTGNKVGRFIPTRIYFAQRKYVNVRTN